MSEQLTPNEAQREQARGRYLCETCFDAMTDMVLMSVDTETGREEAICDACASQGQRFALAITHNPLFDL